jgi:DNA-binding NarL/FixJ family response regulator
MMTAGANGVPLSLPRDNVDVPIRIIAFNGVSAECLSEVPALELVYTSNLQSLQEFAITDAGSVLLVDLATLEETERTDLLAMLGRLNTILAIAVENGPPSNDCESLLRAGFAGVLDGRSSQETFLRAIRAVSGGQLWFPREIISHVLRGFLVEEDLNRLTAREIEILNLIGSGLNNQQIANSLYISRETVRWHVRGLYSKLGIKDRQGAEEYVRYLSVGKKSSCGTIPKFRTLAC